MRRAAAKLCIVLAAGASLATSPVRWTKEDRASKRIVLDDAQPKRSTLLSVESSHHPQVTLPLLVTWDAAVSKPSAALRVAIVADDGSPPFHANVSAFYDASGTHAPSTRVDPVLGFSSCKPPCRVRYTIELERTRGAGESVSVAIDAVASIREVGKVAPPTASVKLRFSP